jgi:hypothetical protein
MVTVSQTDTEVLDRCRQAASAEAGHLGGAGDQFPEGGCSPTIFGRLSASAAMASAVDALDVRMRTELAAAERLLLAVEQAIGAVEASVRDADDAAAQALPSSAV